MSTGPSSEQMIVGTIVFVVLVNLIWKLLRWLWRGAERVAASAPQIAKGTEAATNAAARIAGKIAGKAANAADEAKDAYRRTRNR